MHTNHHPDITARRHGWTACLAVLAATCVALAALLAAPASAPAKVQTFKAAKVKRGVATFRMKGVSAVQIRAARVVTPRRTTAVSLQRVRRAVQRGYLRVRIRNVRRGSHSRKRSHKQGLQAGRAHDTRRRKRSRATLVLETADPSPQASPSPIGRVPQAVGEWPAQGSPPLSDSAAAAQVTPRAENRPGNAGANHYVPSSAELAAFRTGAVPSNRLARYVSGGFAGTTDEILQWAAYKWGFPPDVLRAVAHIESRWDQQALGDPRDGVNAALYPPLSQIDSDSAYESLGITQIKWRPDGSQFPGTEPLRWKSTAFNADFWGASIRYYYDGLCNWCGSGYSAGQGWESVGAHFKPNPWRNSGQLDYINRVKGVLAAPAW